MAVSTTTFGTPLGNQGAAVQEYFLSTSREPVLSLSDCHRYTREFGDPSVYQPILGAEIAAASYSEGAAAVTPTTLSTPSGSTMTPARYKIAVGLTNAAVQRAKKFNDPKKIGDSELRYAMTSYLGKDSTVGLCGNIFSTVTATAGSAADELTTETCVTAAETVRAAANCASAHVFVRVDRKGVVQLSKEKRNSGSPYLGNEALAEEIRALLTKSGINPDDRGYVYSIDYFTHVFMEPGYTTLKQSGGARIGCAYIPANAALQGYATASEQSQRLCPAFGICYDEDPVPAARESMVNPEDISAPCGVITVGRRAFTGGDDLIKDGFGCGVVTLLRDDHACQVLYTA